MGLFTGLSGLFGGLGDLVSGVWAWRSVIAWAVVAIAVLAFLGFLRPVVEVVTKTWIEFALPILRALAENPYSRAALVGVAAFGLIIVVSYFADRGGYVRRGLECDSTIAARERDALAQEVKTLRERLAVLDEIRLKDATQALADAETARQNQVALDALPNPTRPCLDESDARSLWGKP